MSRNTHRFTPDWCHALTLSERAQTLRAARSRVSPTEADRRRAERLLRLWRSQPPFDDPEILKRRLRMDGLSEAEFEYLLAEPVEALAARVAEPPVWLRTILEAYREPQPSPRPTYADMRLTLSAGESQLGDLPPVFLDVIEPLMRRARERLRAGLRSLAARTPEAPFEPDYLERRLFGNLAPELVYLLGRTLVFELRLAVMLKQLRGETPEERFRAFVDYYRQPARALQFLQDYPVLARYLVERIEQWVDFSLTFAGRLCADWRALRAVFHPHGDPGQLTDVDGRVGDRRRRGQSVQILRFETGFQLVYKPRSLALDVHFGELVAWLNGHGLTPPLRTPIVLDRGDHGWMEFVAPETCAAPEQVQRFYRRMGGYLALLYVLEAADFHLRNLIAVGEHPMLVDLECLFHVSPWLVPDGDAARQTGAPSESALLRVGLLPIRRFAGGEPEGIELSGIAGQGGQLRSESIIAFVDGGLDTMRPVRRRVLTEQSRNRPTLNGETVNMEAYTDELLEGFRRMYRLLEQHSAALLSPSGPLKGFHEDETRTLLADTRFYRRLLHDSLHPALLRDALERERFLDRLWVDVKDHPHLVETIPYEKQGLLQGDIPSFSSQPASVNLRAGSGQLIRSILPESGLARVQQRLRGLGAADRDRQLAAIRDALRP